MTDKEIEAQGKLVSMMAGLQEQADLESWDDAEEKYGDMSDCEAND